MNRPAHRTLALRLLASTVVAGGLGLVALAGRASADEPSCDHHGPPPEAYTACDGKAANDACSVQFHDRTMNGTCGAPHGESRLVCIPKDLPPPPADG